MPPRKYQKRVVYVDGFRIRHNFPDFDLIESDETTRPSAGRTSLNPQKPFIPKGQIWIDKRFKKEKDFLLEVLRLECRTLSLSEKKIRSFLKSQMLQDSCWLKEGKLPPEIFVSKRKLGELEICQVRGDMIRRYIDPWFIFGGHDLIYDYIPAKQVWIDVCQDPREIKYTLLHELTERKLMKKGVNYAMAHKKATEKEKRLRVKDANKNGPIKMRPFEQTAGLCGPASLKIVMDYFGRKYGEAELAKICKCNEEGTDHAPFALGAKVLGANVFEKENATMGDIRYFLKKRLPVIVGWWEDEEAQVKFTPEEFGKLPLNKKKKIDDGHFSVVYHLNDEYVYLMDPDTDTGRRKMTIKKFHEKWWDTDTPHFVPALRWMMVVNFDGKKFVNRGGINH